MKTPRHFLLIFAAPLLILVSSLGFLHRNGKDRVQPLPGLVIGFAFIAKGFLKRQRTRKKLLKELRNTQELKSH